jgi:hypothetical protein
MRVSDLIGQEGIEAKHLIHYTYPSDEELQRVGVTGLFLGHYLPWDGLSNTLIAQANGYSHTRSPSSMVNYENRTTSDRHPRLLQVPEVRLRAIDLVACTSAAAASRGKTAWKPSSGWTACSPGNTWANR